MALNLDPVDQAHKAVLDAIRLTKMPQRPSGFETGTFSLDFKARDKANE